MEACRLEDTCCKLVHLFVQLSTPVDLCALQLAELMQDGLDHAQRLVISL